MSVDPRFTSVLIDADATAGAGLIAEATGADHHDALVVLGSGLADVLADSQTWEAPTAVLALSDLPDRDRKSVV